MRGHTSIQMAMRYVHPPEEQKKIVAGKLEVYRIAGIVQVIERNWLLTAIPLPSTENGQNEIPQVMEEIGRGVRI
jgi:hypothetical protein